MNNAGRRKPAIHQPIHTLPVKPPALAPSQERLTPTLRYLSTEDIKRLAVGRDAVVRVVSAQYRTQPLALRGDRFVPPMLQLTSDLVNLGDQPCTHGTWSKTDGMLSYAEPAAAATFDMGLAASVACRMRRRH